MILRINSYYFLRFQVLTATSLKMTAYWEFAPCSLVEVDVSEVLTAPIIEAMISPDNGVSKHL
jgi:hypothetical protein